MKAAVMIIMRVLALAVFAMLLLPPGVMAQDAAQPEQAEKFKKEELVQMLAPIALYPDALIADILMASTYPLEIVEAERWLRQNSSLKGDALDNALKEKNWDPSVKSLCHFPDILYSLSGKLDQTVKLGDAFLAQEEEVMATIQELRKRASDQGNLKTTKEHKVVVEREIIRIEPSAPDIIYVPVYDPLYVYGPWWYPAYLPYYWYYPPGFAYGPYLYFHPFYFRVSFFSWCWFDWHRHRIFIDVVKLRRFHDHPGDRRDFHWTHDPSHRRGVAYRDRRTGERFGDRRRSDALRGPDRRGYPRDGRIDRRAPGGEDRRGPGMEDRRRAPEQPRDRIDRDRPSRERPDDRRGPDQRDRIDRERPDDRRGPDLRDSRRERRITPERDTTFRGVGEGSFERRASERGDMIRQRGQIRQQDGGSRQRVVPEQRRSGGGRDVQSPARGPAEGRGSRR